MQPFAKRIRVNQRTELGNELRVTTEPEICVAAIFQRRESELLEPKRLAAQRAFVAKSVEGRPAPERERVGEELGGRSGIALAQRVPASLHQLREAVRVEGVGRDFEPIAVRVRHHHLARGSERAAELRHRRLERVRGAVRRRLAPQVVDQPIRGDDLASAQEQQRQQRLRLGPRDRNLALTVGNGQSPKDPELHGARVPLRPEVARVLEVAKR